MGIVKGLQGGAWFSKKRIKFKKKLNGSEYILLYMHDAPSDNFMEVYWHMRVLSPLHCYRITMIISGRERCNIFSTVYPGSVMAALPRWRGIIVVVGGSL